MLLFGTVTSNKQLGEGEKASEGRKFKAQKWK